MKKVWRARTVVKRSGITLFRCRVCFAVLLLCGVAHGQSSDADFPLPLAEPTVQAEIAALDVGDARLTRHYYVFTGRAGDIQISVTSENLNGAVDVFTYDALRPVTKVTLLATGGTSKIEKTFFVRRDETLLLRVEGRSAGDEAGRYRIDINNNFARAPESFFAAREVAPASIEVPRTGGRVSSVGARLEDTTANATDVNADATAAAATNQPTGSEVAATNPDRASAALPEVTMNEAATPGVELPRRRNARRPTVATPTRTGNAPRPPRRRTSTAAKTSTTNRTAGNVRHENSATARGDANTTATANDIANDTANDIASDTANETADKATRATVAATPTAPPLRLIIELRDGERIERLMSQVRRVTIENGMLNVVLTSGKRERWSLAGIARTTVEP